MSLNELQQRLLLLTRTARLCLMFSFLPPTSVCLSARADDPPLVRVTTNSARYYIGELLSDDAQSLEIFDFQSNRSVSVTKSSVTRIENPISLDDAARYVGLPAVMGRKISILTEREMPTGKIAKVTPQIVYLTLGESSGITSGQKVSVFRGAGDVIDPDTGKVLARERARIAELEISEVSKSISKARLLGNLEVNLEIGDEVQPQGDRLIVAVCPLSNDDGSVSPTGNSIAEELVTALVQRKVSVVERSALDMVLSELIAQNTILFDQKSAQQVGKLTGASMVLTGKIIPERVSGKAHLRLIDVRTGEILVAVSAPVKLIASSASKSFNESPPSASTRASRMNPARAPGKACKNLIAYENFDGKIGSSLNGQTSGCGWSGSWQGSSNFMISRYNNEGEDRKHMSPARVRSDSLDGNKDIHRNLLTPLDRGNFYLSFVLCPEGDVGQGYDNGNFGVILSSGGITPRDLFIGKPGNTNSYVLENIGGQGQIKTSQAPVAGHETHFVIAAELSTGKDTFRVYINPDKNAPEPETADIIKNDLDIQQIATIFLAGPGAFSVDELKIGRTFEDVMQVRD